MGYFSASENRPADYCLSLVRAAEIYIGIIGFSYGSIVPDRPGQISYTELEFLEATLAGKPRLMFLLSDDAPLPPRLVDANRTAVDAFRGRLRAAGLMLGEFHSADSLEAQIVQALTESRTAVIARERRGALRRAWMVPAPGGPVVARPELTRRVIQSMTAPETGTVVLTTSLEGAGGFGKTTLAGEVCRQPEVQRQFPGGVLWATVGEQADDARVAAIIASLCEVLSPPRPATTDPVVAGARLGELLEDRPPILMVVDDVWYSSQVAPFLIGGQHCQRLITTRNQGVLPRGKRPILVDQMTFEQAVDTITAGLPVNLTDAELRRLLSSTGRWPVLLGLVNAVITDRIQAGANSTEAARWITEQLETFGPTAIDFEDAGSRDSAVTATVAASLQLLTPDERDRYHELVVLPANSAIPTEALQLLWGATGGLGALATARLQDKLQRLRLILGHWADGKPAIRLHDVIRAYLRHAVAPSQLVTCHRALLSSARQLLPADADPTDWWRLPPSAGYLWQQLPFHLRGADREDEMTRLVGDLRWIYLKMKALGSPTPVDADLAMIEATDMSPVLRRAINRSAHLLTPIEPADALGGTLASRLDGIPVLAAKVAAFRQWLPRPRLDPQWQMPDQPNFALHRTMGGHTGPVRGCSFSADGTQLATASRDGTVRIWELPAATLQLTLGDRISAINGCSFAPARQILATANDDGTVRLWNTANGVLNTTLSGHSGPVHDCEFSPDGQRLASVSADGTGRLWDVSSGQALMTFGAGLAAIDSCAFSPNSALVASGAADGTISLWHTANASRKNSMQGHGGSVHSCAFSPDGMLLASASTDRTVRIWETSTGALKTTLTGHSDWVYGCAFSPDGMLLASASTDRTVRIWETSTGTLKATLTGHSDWVYGCAFSPDGTLLASVGADHTVRIWDFQVSLDTGDDDVGGPPQATEGVAAARGTLRRHSDWVYSCAFSPDGMLLATAGDDRRVCIWETASGSLRATFDDHDGWVRGCSFPPDGTAIASASADGKIRIWDLATGTLRSTLTGHNGAVYSVVFAPDGERLASSSGDGTLRVWDRHSGSQLAVMRGHLGPVYQCAFAPDGASILSASDDRTARVWDLASGEPLCVLGHSGSLYGCSFSPDGAWIATAGDDRMVRVWSTGTWTTHQTFAGHLSTVYGCAFSSTGELILSVGTDGTLRIWDLHSGTCIAAMRVAQPLFGCAWEPSNNVISAVGEAGVYLLTYVP
jgi:WD40 repeat protein